MAQEEQTMEVPKDVKIEDATAADFAKM